MKLSKVLVSTLPSHQQRTRGSVCSISLPKFPFFEVILVGLWRHFVYLNIEGLHFKSMQAVFLSHVVYYHQSLSIMLLFSSFLNFSFLSTYNLKCLLKTINLLAIHLTQVRQFINMIISLGTYFMEPSTLFPPGRTSLRSEAQLSWKLPPPSFFGVLVHVWSLCYLLFWGQHNLQLC